MRQAQSDAVAFPRQPFAHANFLGLGATIQLAITARQCVENRIGLAHGQTVIEHQHRHFAKQRSFAKILATQFTQPIQIDRPLLEWHAHERKRQRNFVAVAGFVMTVEDWHVRSH